MIFYLALRAKMDWVPLQLLKSCMDSLRGSPLSNETEVRLGFRAPGVQRNLDAPKGGAFILLSSREQAFTYPAFL